MTRHDYQDMSAGYSAPQTFARPGLAQNLTRITEAEYLGPRASCANGPLYEVRGVEVETGDLKFWFSVTDPRAEPQGYFVGGLITDESPGGLRFVENES